MVPINEYVEYINGLTDVEPYPRGGSTGVYIDKLTEKTAEVSPPAFRLFLYIASDMNSYGQTNRSRKELMKAMGLKYDKKRIYKLFKELSEANMIELFGKVITVNPYIIMPKVRNPKVKAAIQRAWLDIVEYDTQF